MSTDQTTRDRAWIAVLNGFARTRKLTINEVLTVGDLEPEQRETVRRTLKSMREEGLVTQEHHGVYALSDAGLELLEDVLAASPWGSL